MSRVLARPYIRVLVAFSMADVALLMSVGLPVVPAIGFDSFSGTRIDHYCKRFGVRRLLADFTLEQWFHGAPREDDEVKIESPSVTFVGWSPALLNLEQPSQLAAIQAHYENIRTYMGVLFDSEQVWNASNEDIQRLQFSLEHGTYFDVSRALATSLAEVDTELLPDEFATPEPQATQPTCPIPETYAEARNIWESLQRQSASAEQQKQAWDHLIDFHEREIIAPLMSLAMDAADPREQVRNLALIDVTRLSHLQGLLMNARQERSIRDNGTRDALAIPKEDWQQLMASVDRVRALTAERKPCRRKRKK